MSNESPAVFAHRTGKEMRASIIGVTDNEEIERIIGARINEILQQLFDEEASDEVLIQTTRTYLKSYDLPIIPDSIKLFDEYYQKVHQLARSSKCPSEYPDSENSNS